MKRLIIPLFVILLSACGLPEPEAEPPTCASVSKQFVSDTLAILKEWRDVTNLAANTSRIALSPVINQMQGVRRRAEDLKYPSCAVKVHGALIAHMNAEIELYLAFMGQEADSKISDLSHQSLIELKTFTELMAVLQK